MTNFTKTRLTDKGLALLAKTGVSVTVTKVKAGNGEYQTDADIGAMTELKSEKQEFQITSTQKKTDTTYAIKFVMSNKELAEDYLFTEIGIYASDPDEGEILYAVCYAENKDADMIRKYSGLYEFKAIIVLNIQVNAGGVVNVVEQGLYALAEDLEELREEVGDKVDKEEGKGLSHNDFTDADKKKLDGIDEGANKTVIDSELNSYSSNPVQNQVVYEEMLKRMAQKWVGSHLYTLYGIVAPSTVNGANTGSHYLDVKTGNTYIMTRYTDRGAQAWTNTGTLQSVEEILNSKFDKSNIANNLVTTEEGYVADARQLNESIKGSFAEKIINKLSYISSRIKSSTIYEKLTKTISSTEEVAYAFNNPGIYYFNCHCIAYGTSSACLLLVSGSGSVEEAGIIILGKIEKTITFAVESSFLANGTQVVYVPRLKLNIPSGARGEYTKSLYQII